MTGEWSTMTLREANVSLIDCDHRTPPAADIGYPYVAIPQLRGGRIDLSDVRRITHGNFLEWTRKAKPSANDVILSRRCNPGETAVAPPELEFALGQNLVLLRADGTKVYPPFLRWLVRGPEWWEQINKFINVGAVFDSLKCADVPNFELRIPPISEQRSISYILGTLDDKIELNRRMNETLEAMARAIFKSWFVDFDPVRAKAEGRDPGLPKHIADLFPDRFENSELGEIPVGWKARPLNEVLTAKNERVGEADVPEYSSTNDGLQLRSERFDKQLSASTSKNKLILHGDLVFGLSRQVLNFGLMRDPVGCVSPAYKVFAIDKDAVLPDLLERIMRIRSSYFYNAISASSREGQSISSDGLGLLKFVQPRVAAQNAFYVAMEPLLTRAKSLQSESHTIATLRDMLLSKLLLGEVRVNDSERSQERTV